MNRFKQCRELKNLTQKEVALSLKVSIQAISYWENGNRMPSNDNLQKLSALYGVSIDYLLGSPASSQLLPDPQNAEEYELLMHFRRLSPSARDLLMKTIRLYAANPLMIQSVPLAKQAT